MKENRHTGIQTTDLNSIGKIMSLIAAFIRRFVYIDIVLICLISLISSKIALLDQKRVIRWINGKFDNLVQATQDRVEGRPTASTGGHEHVTATFKPYPFLEDSILAAFTFGYDPSKTFRFRLYKFGLEENDYSKPLTSITGAYMKIFKPSKSTEDKLKAVQYDTNSYCPSSVDDFEELKGCDVIWKPYGPISKLLSKYQSRLPNNIVERFLCYRGSLMNEPCEIYSAINPNVLLVVKDDLRLWKHQIWINDQVFLKNGTRIIGNTRGIHYKFDKVVES